jgi:hypothetical protein
VKDFGLKGSSSEASSSASGLTGLAEKAAGKHLRRSCKKKDSKTTGSDTSSVNRSKSALLRKVRTESGDQHAATTAVQVENSQSLSLAQSQSLESQNLLTEEGFFTNQFKKPSSMVQVSIAKQWLRVENIVFESNNNIQNSQN